MDMATLVEILSDVKPVEFKGVQLLKELRSQHPGQLVPQVPPEKRDDLIEATTELMAYSQRCEQIVKNLSSLEPIPLKGIQIIEFAL